MAGEAVFFGVDGDGGDSEFSGGTEDADGDFAAICYEKFLLGGHVKSIGCEVRMWWRGEPITKLAKVTKLGFWRNERETCKKSEFWAMGDTANVFGYLHGVSVALPWEIPPRISKETNDVFKILRK